MTGPDAPGMDRPVICYVADCNYIFPTLLSVLSLRRFTSTKDTDVLVFALGLNPEMLAKSEEAFAALNSKIIPADPSRISGYEPKKYNKTHVPAAALGRLFIAEMLPEEYTRIIYVDGDTWFSRDPIDIVKHIPQEGFIAAAEDPASLFRHNLGSNGRNIREYLDTLRIPRATGYFNSGVLLCSTLTYRDISEQAFRFFVDNTEICRFHDQSALNVVSQGRREHISPRWNFATSFCLWNMEKSIAPAIYHFTGGAKPWTGLDAIWTDIRHIYREASADLERSGFDSNRRSLDEIRNFRAKVLFSRLKNSTILHLRYRDFRRELAHLHNNAMLK